MGCLCLGAGWSACAWVPVGLPVLGCQSVRLCLCPCQSVRLCLCLCLGVGQSASAWVSVGPCAWVSQ